MRNSRLITLFLLVAVAGAACASEPAAARVQGMGGAGAALPFEAVTVFYNPAGIYLQDRIALDLTFRFDDIEWPGNWGLSYLKYQRSSGRGAGFGIYRMKTSDSYGSGDAIAALLATVYKTPIGIPVGLSFKYINENWNETGREGYFTSDLGVMKPFGGWIAGLTFQSVTKPGSKIFPYRLLLGISRSLGGKITAAFQTGVDSWDDLKNLHQAEYRFGLELRASKSLTLQGGHVKTTEEDYWTGGFGLVTGGGLTGVYFAYHWYPELDGSDRSFVSYSYYLK